MDYEIVTLEEKRVVGLIARTSNDSADMTEKIGGLWQKFMAETVFTVKNRANDYVIGLYFDYDETSYNVTVGAEVSSNGNAELTEKIIPSGKYAKFFVRGDVVKAVADAWDEIWAMPLDRSYAADFEEYVNNVNGIADINLYISLK